MHIGDLARVLGISRDTIKRLERKGLLAPKRDWAGHRRFTAADLERVRVFLFQRKGPQKRQGPEAPQ